jgi:hypothetical protein
MSAVGKIGEAIFRSNAAPVTPEKTLCCLAQEPEVFEFDEPTSNRVFVETHCHSGVAARKAHVAVIEPVVA